METLVVLVEVVIVVGVGWSPWRERFVFLEFLLFLGFDCSCLDDSWRSGGSFVIWGPCISPEDNVGLIGFDLVFV
jgi:hypothetical protein